MKKLIDKIIFGLTIEEYHHLLSELNCCVVETALPFRTKAFTVKQEDGHIVYLNSRLDDLIQKRALQHEMLHIWNEDFRSDKLLVLKEACYERFVL